MLDLPAADPRLSWFAPRVQHEADGSLRPERFGPEAARLLAGQIGPLANLRSPAGCALVLACDAPWIELRLRRLRHHQPFPVGIDLEIGDGQGGWQCSSSPDLRPQSGDLTLRLATGLERGGPLRECWLWLPLVSTCVVAGLGLPEGSRVEAVPLPEPDWLALGDSLTQGFSVAQPTQAWLHVVGRACGLRPRNLGVAGLRVEAELYAEVLTRPWPLISIGLGSNHAWRETDFEGFEDRLRALLARLDPARHRRVLWLLPPWKPCEEGLGPPSFMGLPLDRAAGRRVAQLRERLAALLAAEAAWIEQVPPLMPRDQRLYPDGLHPQTLAAAAQARALAALLGTRLGDGV